jgi:H+/Cl- antiporter ClcA
MASALWLSCSFSSRVHQQWRLQPGWSTAFHRRHRVMAVLHRQVPQAPFRLIPVTFFGGLLAIGSGMALGREGPSVQMGASLAQLIL